MALVSISEGRAATPAQLRAAERRLRCSLPSQYAAFCSAHDGGVPSPSQFPIQWALNPAGSIDRFYSLSRGEVASVTAALGPAIPRDCICIGSTGVCDEILLSVRGGRRGYVFYWDSYHSGPRRSSAVHLVARSFAAFLNALSRRVSVKASANAGRSCWGNTIPSFLRGRVPKNVSRESGPDVSTLVGKVHFSGPALSEKDGYRAFLLECNGGCPRADLLTLRVNRAERYELVAGFYGFQHENPSSSIECWQNLLDGLIPVDCIPIGDLSGQNQILLAVSGTRRGTLFLWDAWSRSKQPDRRTEPIARSFEEFAEMLSIWSQSPRQIATQ